jgi:hypothetical protein
MGQNMMGGRYILWAIGSQSMIKLLRSHYMAAKPNTIFPILHVLEHKNTTHTK